MMYSQIDQTGILDVLEIKISMVGSLLKIFFNFVDFVVVSP